MAGTHAVTRSAGRLAAEHPALVRLARFGWLAKGVVYALAGVLALVLTAAALGWSTSTATEASPTGAIEEVAASAAGPALLWLLAVGLFLYALWRLVTAFLPADGDASSWAHRIGYLVSAALYGFLGILAVRFALHQASGASTNGNQEVTDWTQRFLENAAGRWLVGVVGAVLVAVGAYRVVKGLKLDVEDELDLAGIGPERRAVLQRLGALGEIGRGVAIGLVGFFLVRAAWTYRAAEATGLDGALRRLAESWWGTALVALVGLGFLAYGLFCSLTFLRRRLESP
jgi:hypothetical protein